VTVERGPSDPGPRTGTVVLGRDRRLGAQIAALAAVGLLVVLGGLGLGAPPDGTDGPSPSGDVRSPAPSGSRPATVPSDGPSAAPGACTPVTAGALPTVRLRSTSGDQNPVPGAGGPGPAGEPAGSSASTAWAVPGLEHALLLPSGARLVLDAARSACISSVVITVDDAESEPPGSTAGDVRVVRPPDPRNEVELGPLPRGDWVVKVIVFMDSNDAGPAIRREAFFRVVASDSPILAPSPEVTPAVACGPDPIGSGSPDLVLVIDNGTPIPSQEDPEASTPIEVGLGQAIEVRSAGDICARGWSIEVADGLGNAFLQESYPNPVDNPFLAAQNRWTLTQLLIGDSRLTSTIQFGRDRAKVGTWRLHLGTPDLPAAFATSGDVPGVPVLPGCGQYWTVPGHDAFEPCVVQTIPDDLESLRIQAGSVVRVDVEGWTVASWFARCGADMTDAIGTPAEFVTWDGCDLGERYGHDEIVIVPWPGDRLILIGISVERDGVTAYGNYYLRVVAE